MSAPAASTAAPVLAPTRRATLRSRGLLNGRVVFGSTLVLIVVAVAVVGMMWTPYPADAPNLNARFAAPQMHHLLGTDELGRDILSRAMVGARTSLIISVSAVAIAAAIGTVIGFLTGYLRGVIDIVLSRIIDAMLAVPALVLALGIVAMLGASATSVTVALAVAYTPTFARVLRGVVVAARDHTYVEASRGLGLPAIVVVVKDLLPSVLPIMVVQVTTSLAWGILDEANLGFLGLGVQPPAPSWGSLLIEGRQYMYDAPWLSIGAGAFVVMAVLGVNTLGDGLRDVLDPRAWTRRHNYRKRGGK
ncbi:ABC transporter permease [Actinacidiphila oryziradicis]|uniref:ABC transporter permease n=1 Tax=Actinacidiphila oryziradicis TaxID=2571141 RepID=A0A4U0S2C0_9ACTN|nr:ABC transporter permease [Actinacidiphila oryziradicis]TKA01181.1 ABC transporter permease [Actinacidiphila oryziradicis]